jgi:tritrans,polycis-undecaprenyl-diphosphate synthase [geranylgeranyl-diphosphate specific]
MLTGLLKTIGAYRVYERWLTEQVKKAEMPRHIGVILDGNRRWAAQKLLSAAEGHMEGAETGEDFLEWCLSLGIKVVTVYAFSAENFRRTQTEVQNILSLIEREALRLKSDPRIHKERVRVKALGRLEYLPESLRLVLHDVEDATRDYDGHYLNLAIAYGGRAEIVDAAKKIAHEVQEQRVAVDQIDEELFMQYLYTAHLPNPYPDLIIRTSGEERLSGFLLWQSAYSELCFIDVWWPDFRKIDLLRAVRTYQKRLRKFGR